MPRRTQGACDENFHPRDVTLKPVTNLKEVKRKVEYDVGKNEEGFYFEEHLYPIYVPSVPDSGANTTTGASTTAGANKPVGGADAVATTDTY
jgi:hypothetical protein